MRTARSSSGASLVGLSEAVPALFAAAPLFVMSAISLNFAVVEQDADSLTHDAVALGQRDAGRGSPVHSFLSQDQLGGPSSETVTDLSRLSQSSTGSGSGRPQTVSLTM